MAQHFYDGQIKRYITQIVRLMSNFSYKDAKGNEVVVEEHLILKKVETDVMYKGSINTILTFNNGSQKQIKVKTFDKDLNY